MISILHYPLTLTFTSSISYVVWVLQAASRNSGAKVAFTAMRSYRIGKYRRHGCHQATNAPCANSLIYHPRQPPQWFTTPQRSIPPGHGMSVSRAKGIEVEEVTWTAGINAFYSNVNGGRGKAGAGREFVRRMQGADLGRKEKKGVECSDSEFGCTIPQSLDCSFNKDARDYGALPNIGGSSTFRPQPFSQNGYFGQTQTMSFQDLGVWNRNAGAESAKELAYLTPDQQPCIPVASRGCNALVKFIIRIQPRLP
ncbi:hypothetical protein AB1N83_011871 [Pleurotus pulmonarius]